MRLHPKLLLASALIATVMIPVQLFLSAVGVLVLKMAGGAATDTSLVVTVAAIAVTDFWGGGIVYMLTRAERSRIVVAWAIARVPLLVLIGLFSRNLALLAPVTLALGLLAAWAGARMAASQSALARRAAADRERQTARAERRQSAGS